MVAPGAKKPSSSRLDAAAQEALRARHEALTLVEEQFRDFDVVWAKVLGFPWWPGVLFLSWDVVRRAGIRTDPKIVASLVMPPPQKVPVLDAATGEETGEFRVKRHCLVMFLDKFNFSLVEIDPSSVASFTAHYQMHEHAIMGSKSGKWAKKKTEFKRALVKAVQLLHMGNDYTEDDLVLWRSRVSREEAAMDEIKAFEDKQGDESLDNAWDDRRVQMESKEVMEIDQDEIFIPAKPRRKHQLKIQVAGPKTVSKGVSSDAHAAIVSRSPSPIDLTESPESEKKKLHKNNKASGKPSRITKKKANGDVGATDAKSKQHGRLKVLCWTTMKTNLSNIVNRLPKKLYKYSRKGAEQSGADAAVQYLDDWGVWQTPVAVVQQSQIRQNLMTGNLDPHTMVQCAAYRPKDYVEDPNSRSRGGPTLDPRSKLWCIRTQCSWQTFTLTLPRARSSASWVESGMKRPRRCTFRQRFRVARLKSKATMDLQMWRWIRAVRLNCVASLKTHNWRSWAGIIHIRHLRRIHQFETLRTKPATSNYSSVLTPAKKWMDHRSRLWVSLLNVRHSTEYASQSLRYFHTRGEKVSGGARREIYMPYEFIPGRRHFRSVLQDEERARTRFFPMYHSVLERFKLELTSTKLQLPKDIKAPAGQRTTSRSSPARVKVQGPVRKRKQSSDDTVDKPKEASVSNGVAAADVEMASVVESSSAEGNNACSTGIEKEKSDLLEIKPQVAEILADVVVATEVVNVSEEMPKNLRIAQTPQRIKESSDGDEDKHNRSISPPSEGPSPARSPSPNKQTFYQHFKHKGLAFQMGVPMKKSRRRQLVLIRQNPTTFCGASGEEGGFRVTASTARVVANGSSGSSTDKVPLFGSNSECEDIQTSLQRMAGHLEILKSLQLIKTPSEAETKPRADATPEPKSKLIAAKTEAKQDGKQDHLTALRTKYGPGVSGCAEQVITLVDYYRDFERRTDLSEIWKSRITKLEKIESSLSEYVQYLNIPAVLRQDFIKVNM
ncbi:PWWP domain [Phytophthora cactorum]|nr:PWWP domain [Phytophthora cactorum]